ncbi:5-methylcytosine restriction system specificity protein McrC [Companilactobacillus suantsaicola]|nr:guanosine 5'-monophosphate oxidoreductase [Companilactobacillus suantsaicola]
MINITDNQKIKGSSLIVHHFLNKDIKTLQESNFIIFPRAIYLDNNNYLFRTRGKEIHSCNYVGYLNYKSEQMKIRSRFTNEEFDQDYFLRHMLQTVLNYNISSSVVGTSEKDSYLDLLSWIFPYYLTNALKKGLYKEYVLKRYNDSNIRGKLNISTQIKKNIPFTGNFAYESRVISYDNQITELIRHTIEKISKKNPGILTNDKETKDAVRLIRSATGKYSKDQRNKVIQDNLNNPAKTGYFDEYTALQKLCLQILDDKKIAYGEMSESKVRGILIDVAWLWENYIAKISGMSHYGRVRKLKTLHLFKDIQTKGFRYPDFVSKNEIPIDTKYKLNLNTRDDYNQMITYIHLLRSAEGIFLKPDIQRDKEEHIEKIGEVDGMGGTLKTYRFFIPQGTLNYQGFESKIKNEEDHFTQYLTELTRK